MLSTDRSFSLKNRLILSFFLIFLMLGGCSYRILFWERNIWEDFRGIFAMAEPEDLTLYRRLLPSVFQMPDAPMVGVFVVDYMETEPWMVSFTEVLSPYLEASVFLRCVHDGKIGWHSLTMPVTTRAALIGGLRLGYPKYVADKITLAPSGDGWEGKVMHKGRVPIRLEFTPFPENEVPLQILNGLHPLQATFVSGKGDADLTMTIYQLVPPGEGPDVETMPLSPPPLALRQKGMVRVTLGEPWNGLVKEGTTVPGLFQRFALDATRQ